MRPSGPLRDIYVYIQPGLAFLQRPARGTALTHTRTRRHRHKQTQTCTSSDSPPILRPSSVMSCASTAYMWACQACVHHFFSFSPVIGTAHGTRLHTVRRDFANALISCVADAPSSFWPPRRPAILSSHSPLFFGQHYKFNFFFA